ncbi:MAG: iron chaperone [Terriglobia bacterium]
MKSGNRRSAAKGRGAPKNVDEYLAGVPEPAGSTLSKMRAAIRSAVPPEATEAVSYRLPAFRHNGVLVWFAAFANHCSSFPTAAVIEAFKNELKGYSLSKGTIHFSTDKPLPASLVKKMVKLRVAQNESKKRR